MKPLNIKRIESVLNQSVKDSSMDDLRDCIDSIDHHIASSIAYRLQLAKKVGEYKARHAPQSQLILRPAREATVLREWSRFLQSDMSPLGSQQLWRLLISSSCLHEQDLSLWIPHSEQASLEADRYFGSFFPRQSYHSISDVLATFNVEQHILVLDIAMVNETDWQALITWQRESGCHGFVSLPFISTDPSYRILCVGKVPLESSGDDVTMVHIQSTTPLKASEIHATYDATSSYQISQTQWVISLMGWVTDASLLTIPNGHTVHILGTIPKPMEYET